MNDGQVVLSVLSANISENLQKRCEAILQGISVRSDCAALDAHVAAKAVSTGQANGGLVLTQLLTPTYFDLHLKSSCIDLPKAKVKRIAASVAELEQAATYQFLANHSTSQFQQAWVDSATACLKRFDELVSDHAKIEEAAKSGRQKGGRNRRRDTPKLLRLAVRFLETKAPETKWKNQTHAVEVIAQLLSGLVLKHNRRAAKTDDTWVKNIRRLINTDPRANEVFRRHSRKAIAKAAPPGG